MSTHDEEPKNTHETPMSEHQSHAVWYDPNEQYRQLIDLLDYFKTCVFRERFHNAIGNSYLDILRRQTRAIQMRIESEFTLVVLGEFKRGKSTLVNALLRAPVATIDITPETLTINQFHYGPEPFAEIRLRDGRKATISIDELKSERLVPVLDKVRGGSRQSGHLSGRNFLLKLRDILTEHLDTSDFRDLCFRLGIEYDHLPGETLPDKIRELIVKMNRRSQIDELTRACYEERPDLQNHELGDAPGVHGTSRSVNLKALQTKLEELQDKVSHLVIYTPVEWMRGMCLVDTPGINDLDRFDEQVGHYIAQADAIIFVVSARSPFGETERNFLQRYVLSRDFAKVFFVVNEMDRLTSQNYQRLLQEVRSRIHQLFPQALVFGISALQEFERTQSSMDMNIGHPALAQEFERFRTMIQDSLLLNRDIIRQERILLQSEEMLGNLEIHLERSRRAINTSQQIRDAAITEYQDHNSELNRKLEQHKKQVHMAIDELCDQACAWVDEFLVRFEQEAIPYIEHVRFGETQRHFHFFLSDSLRAAVSRCIDAQRPAFLDLLSSIRQSIQEDIDALNDSIFANRDIDQSIVQVTPVNNSWANLDGVQVLVDQSLMGMFGFAGDLVVPLAGFLVHQQKQTEEQRKKKYQEYLSVTMPELRLSVIDALRSLYHDLGGEVEKLIEEDYQRDIESSLLAIREAQELQAEGEQEITTRRQDLAEVSSLVTDTREQLRLIKQRLWPEELIDEAPPTAARQGEVS